MSVSVEIDRTTGDAVLKVVANLTEGQPLQVSVLDTKTRRYLSPSGWASNRKVLARVNASTGSVSVPVPAALATLLAPGTPCLLEEIHIGLRLSFIWPAAPVAEPTPAPLPHAAAAPEEPPEPAAPTEVAPSMAAEDVLVATRSEAPRQPEAPHPESPSEAADTPPVSRPRRRYGSLALAFTAGILIMLVPLFHVWQTPGEAAGQQLRTLDEQWKAVQKDLRGQITKLLDERDETSRTADRARVDYENRISALTMELDRFKNGKNATPSSSEESELKVLNDLLDEAKAENRQLSAQVEELSSKASSQTAAIEGLRAEVHDLQDQLTRAQATERGRAVWLAVAYDPENGHIHTIENQWSESEARRIALNSCAGADGHKCSIMRTLANGCVSVARIEGEKANRSNWVVIADTAWQDAEARALDDCGKKFRKACRTSYTNCSPEGLAKPK